MTNSSPQPPLPPRPNGSPQERGKKRVVTFDEAIAIFVAFATIGFILFWSLNYRKEGFSLSDWKNVWLFFQDESESIRGTISSQIKRDNILIGKTDSDTSELTSKYIGKKSESSVGLDTPTINRKPIPLSDLLTTAAPVATGLTAGKPETTTETPTTEVPDQTTEKPPAITDTTPPETTEKPPAITDTTPPETTEKPPAITDTTPPETTEKPPAITDTKPKTVFQDVPDTYWAYPFVEKLGKKKLISGSSKNQLFEPNKLITRASMATLISQAFDQPASQKAKNFIDVSKQNATAADIKKAVETGFMKGYSDQEFRPQEKIPRYQVLVALATGLGLKASQDTSKILGQFNDADQIPDWAKEQLAAATEAELVVNPPEVKSDSLQPNREATRAEVAAMIHQALVKLNKLKPIESKYILKP